MPAVVDPSVIVLPPPVTLIAGAVPTPLTAKVKGLVVVVSFSLKTDRGGLRARGRRSELDRKGRAAAGCHRSGGLAGDFEIAGARNGSRSRAALPLLATVKVSLTGMPTGVLPNAVAFTVLVVEAPSLIDWLSPLTEICGAEVTVNVKGRASWIGKSSELVVSSAWATRFKVPVKPAVGVRVIVAVPEEPGVTCTVTSDGAGEGAVSGDGENRGAFQRIVAETWKLTDLPSAVV